MEITEQEAAMTNNAAPGRRTLIFGWERLLVFL
jgi:hypothetical protein